MTTYIYKDGFAVPAEDEDKKAPDEDEQTTQTNMLVDSVSFTPMDFGRRMRATVTGVLWNDDQEVAEKALIQCQEATLRFRSIRRLSKSPEEK